MPNLTSRCMLNNIIDWYESSRKWNKVGALLYYFIVYMDFIPFRSPSGAERAARQVEHELFWTRSAELFSCVSNSRTANVALADKRENYYCG